MSIRMRVIHRDTVKMRAVHSSAVNMRVKDVSTVKIIPNAYEGDYILTPKIEEQKFPTAEKYMLDDVTVKAIPYYETDNQLGTTVYIGNEVEIYGN